MSDDKKMRRTKEEKELLINARKPKGDLGDKLLDRMNKSHESLAQWGVSHLDISKDDVILDIGCGGGVNLERFLKMTDNKVYGLDYSEIAVEKSIKLNQAAIDDGRCEIIQGSVSDLPFDDNSFDIVTCFETVYFWPDFLNDSKEVRRVLKDDGIMFICNEAIPNEDDEGQNELIDLLDMDIYSEDEFDEYLREAGFSDIICFSKDGSDSLTKEVTGWLCVIARK
ncbi:class I SAM-dependent methyltransferase [Methanobrevibacter olleyae]|uniref:Methyltransferase domain-containing protein n=1 Tax=Methanobrevibacter olleyae TaxID=294671 RepID=A0A126QZZ6_METOL|nr:class I SAM-dependent methyltransferase [Methanobrevibacter olleyae]AMK15690.1 SAM-dependent methyltransferase [Methanobrevibacter olleyae]SFL22994.1 Methyltransferase domain-containing protein [Methanobrevibacter olleyae]